VASSRRLRFEPSRLLPRYRRSLRPGPVSRYRALRPANRALAESLDQLRQGVPLNWTQVEDDPELVTLASLHGAAQERREQFPSYVQASRKAELFARLSAQLPEYRPDPVKEPPRALAGFSENVPVLTQAEEDVPQLTSNLLPWIGASLATAVAVIMVFTAITSAANTLFKPETTFTWIQVEQDGQVITPRHTPAGWSLPQCVNYSLSDPTISRAFLPIFDRGQIELSAGFPVQFLPTSMSLPTTYTLSFSGGAIAPCTEIVPDPNDPASTVKLSYTARRTLPNGYATISPLTIFQTQRQPITVDVSTGEWKEVQAGATQGIYWRGAPYLDIEGTTWIGDVSVMVVESGDLVTTYVGQPGQGVTEEMLIALVQQTSQQWSARQTEISKPLPQFNWIEITRGDDVISASKQGSASQGQPCATPMPKAWGIRRTFQYAGSISDARQYAGFPLATFPQAVNVPVVLAVAPTPVGPGTPTPPVLTETVPSTVTLVLADFAVHPCDGMQLTPSDPGAIVKLRYTARRSVQGGFGLGRLSDIVFFQSYQQTASVDIGMNSWKEVQLNDAHGIVWTGSGYRDPEGIEWPDVSVIVFEKGDTVITMVGSSTIGSATLPTSPGFSQGMAEDILTEIARVLSSQ